MGRNAGSVVPSVIRKNHAAGRGSLAHEMDENDVAVVDDASPIASLDDEVSVDGVPPHSSLVGNCSAFAFAGDDPRASILDSMWQHESHNVHWKSGV